MGRHPVYCNWALQSYCLHFRSGDCLAVEETAVMTDLQETFAGACSKEIQVPRSESVAVVVRAPDHYWN